MQNRLSVIVPAFNEAKTISTVVEKLLRVPNLFEIIIVDDCSSDETPRIAQGLAETYEAIRVIRHDRNQGKTAALKSGFAVSRGDIVIVQDADLEYDPSEIADVIEPIVNGVADVVYGSRFLVRRATRVLYYYHFLANKLLTTLSNLFTNVNLTDVETGYKAFRGEIIRNMIISSKGFGFEIEVTAKVAKIDCVLYEVPISYYGRTYHEGKKIGFQDAIAAFWYIFRYNVLCSAKRSYRTLPIPGLASQSSGLESALNYTTNSARQ
jgi:glycosyltransferase involved in cell wall biosynthesis